MCAELADPTATALMICMSDRVRIKKIVEKALIDIIKILDESKPLIMEITAALWNYRGTSEQSFPMFGHGDNKVTARQDIVLGDFARIPLLVCLHFLVKTALVEEIAWSQNDV